MMAFRAAVAAFILPLSFVCAGSVETVLQEHAEALGGLENLRKIKSVYAEGTVVVGGMTGTTTTYSKSPDKYRIDLNLPIMSQIQACDGNDCWSMDKQGFAQTLTLEFEAMLHTQAALDRWEYLDLENFTGSVIVADTEKIVDRMPCYLLEVKPVNGLTSRLYISRENHLLVRVDMTTDFGTIYSSFSDYREIEGVMVPFMSVQKTEAGIVSGVTTIDLLRVNLPLDDSLFHRPSEEKRDISKQALEDSVIIPFELKRNHIFIKVEINDGEIYDFLFDSGAGGTAVDSRVIEKLSLPHLGTTEARGVGGAEEAEAFLLRKAKMRGVEINELPVVEVDLSFLERAGGEKIDGVIGYDLLSRYLVKVDYSQLTLTFYPPDHAPSENWGARCPLLLDFRLPYVDLTLNDSISGRFRLDTGSRSTLDLNRPFVETHHLLDDDRSSYREVRSLGVGGQTTGLLGILPSLEVCGFKIDSAFVNFSTAEEGLFAGAATAGNIGGGILKRFVIVFDYPHEAVFFTKTQEFDLYNRIRNMAGVIWRRKGEEIVVIELLRNRMADGTLDVGDVIVEIDNVKLAERMDSEINELLSGSPGAVAELVVKRGGKMLKKSLISPTTY